MATGKKITITDTATAIRTGDTGASGARLIITNDGGGSVALGDSSVVYAEGYELKNGASITVELSGGEELYGITNTGTDVINVLETGE